MSLGLGGCAVFTRVDVVPVVIILLVAVINVNAVMRRVPDVDGANRRRVAGADVSIKGNASGELDIEMVAVVAENALGLAVAGYVLDIVVELGVVGLAVGIVGLTLGGFVAAEEAVA